MAIPREELCGLVWAKPMTHVAKRFKVPGSYKPNRNDPNRCS